MNYLDTLPEEIIEKIYFDIHKSYMEKIIYDVEIPFAWCWFHSLDNPKRMHLNDDKYNI